MTADRPRFSIAITVWRQEHLLARALQSVLRQIEDWWEILVLSDGRSWEARQIVRHFGNEPRIRYRRVRRRRKAHGNHLRRLALEETTGSHLVILGHDCLLYPGYLAAHRCNLDGDREGLSVVPVDYWRETVPDGVMPRHPDLATVGEGEIDLLCLALPRRRALEADCFGDDMLYFRCADYLSFSRLRERTPPRLYRGPTQAAHF